MRNEYGLATRRRPKPHRTALLTITVALMTSLGPVSGWRLKKLPFILYRRALLILRSAESAVRRLIVIVAHEMKLRDVKLRPARRDGLAEFFVFSRPNPKAGDRLPAFNLNDPLKLFGREAPDMDWFGFGENSDAQNFEGFDKTLVPVASLGLRILALKHALENLPRHAKRLAVWYEQRDLAYAQNLAHRYSPMRPRPRASVAATQNPRNRRGLAQMSFAGDLCRRAAG